MKSRDALWSYFGYNWALHIGVPECWGWRWGYNDGAAYEYLVREIALGPLFTFVWRPS